MVPGMAQSAGSPVCTLLAQPWLSAQGQQIVCWEKQGPDLTKLPGAPPMLTHLPLPNSNGCCGKPAQHTLPWEHPTLASVQTLQTQQELPAHPARLNAGQDSTSSCCWPPCSLPASLCAQWDLATTQHSHFALLPCFKQGDVPTLLDAGRILRTGNMYNTGVLPVSCDHLQLQGSSWRPLALTWPVQGGWQSAPLHQGCHCRGQMGQRCEHLV